MTYQYAEISPGNKFAYLDSWRDGSPHKAEGSDASPPNSYTTIIGLHGVGFNSKIFLPLFPHLPPNVRFLAYNQRSYEGSPPAISDESDATKVYLKDMVDFVEWSIENLGLPKQEDAQKEEGGVVLLGWSKGTVLPLLLLSPSSPSLPSNSLLPTHLRSIILFEPPGSSLGLPPTSDLSSAFSKVLITDQEPFAEAFRKWIIGPNGIWDENKKLAWEKGTVSDGFGWKMASTAPEVAILSRQILASPSSPSPSSSLNDEWKSRVPIGLLYGSNTVEYCQDAANTIQKWWKKSTDGTRRTAVTKLEGAGHFAMSEMSGEFEEAVMALVGELEVGVQSLP